MSYGSEITRLALQALNDTARGMGRAGAHTNSFRQSEISILNVNDLPVKPNPDDGSNTPAQAPGGALYFLMGYSAAAGSSAAAPDATGRSGDVLQSSRPVNGGSGRGTVLPSILTPGTAEGSGSGTATMIDFVLDGDAPGLLWIGPGEIFERSGLRPFTGGIL